MVLDTPESRAKYNVSSVSAFPPDKVAIVYEANDAKDGYSVTCRGGEERRRAVPSFPG